MTDSYSSRKDRHMETTPRASAPLWAAIRMQLRQTRQARAARRTLERELANYTTQTDRNDLDAVLDRHSEQETADIRRILAAHRSA
jgi:hypothetical protein